MEDKFKDLGINAILGSDIMWKLGISEDELKIPGNFEKMKDVIEFLKEIPTEEISRTLSRVTVGKNVDKLDHMWQYSMLSKQRMDLRKQLNSLEDEISYYE